MRGVFRTRGYRKELLAVRSMFCTTVGCTYKSRRGARTIRKAEREAKKEKI